jgi:hypothetical protein
MQSGPLNYHDWFERQSDANKLDILGPSRYQAYKNGMLISSFVKDNKILSLKELSLDRVTRAELLEREEAQEGQEQSIKERFGEKFEYDSIMP